MKSLEEKIGYTFKDKELLNYYKLILSLTYCVVGGGLAYSSRNG